MGARSQKLKRSRCITRFLFCKMIQMGAIGHQKLAHRWIQKPLHAGHMKRALSFVDLIFQQASQPVKKLTKVRRQPDRAPWPPYHTYLAAHGISRAALKGTKRVSTYSLFELASQAIDGASLETALARSKHSASELEAELKRSKQDLSRAR